VATPQPRFDTGYGAQVQRRVPDTLPRTLDEVGGWYRRTDQLVMDWLLGYQESAGVTGDLLEMGAYLGKSAILIGRHRRPGERFVVCDLFGEEPPTAENRKTAQFYTENLTRAAFEFNYAAFHSESPEVLQAPTSELPEHVKPGTCRFVHVDACHLYNVVREDVQIARSVLIDDGIVVFDDIRSAHTPGVPAAVWPEVATGGLRLICLTPNKLYATWGDAKPIQDAMLEWLRAQPASKSEVQQVTGERLIRVSDWTTPPPCPVPPNGPPPARSLRVTPRAKRIVVDLLPPIVTRTIKRARAAAQNRRTAS
jgi:predicted O-methyltransferase YrrM